MKKTRILAAMLLAVCLGLAGCMPPVDYPQTETVLPSASLQDRPAAPQSAESTVFAARVQLWYPTADGDRLTSREAGVRGADENELYAVALSAMLEAGQGVFPQDVKLQGVECAGAGLAIAAWEVPKRIGEADLFALLCASANTLGSLGAKAAAFRVNGTPPRIQGWPVGALLPGNWDLTGMWARLELESERQQCVRNAFVFRASLDGSSVVPELTSITLIRDGETDALLSAMRGESGMPGAAAAFPADTAALRGGPELEDGALRLNMDANLLAILESEDIHPWQMYAATACTLLSFMPEAEGVEIFVGNARVGRADTGTGQIRFEDGLMRWDSFTEVRACAVTVYLMGEDGLVPSPRYLRTADCSRPLALLTQVLSGFQAWEHRPDAPAIPPDLDAEADISGLSMEDGEIRVNLAPSFRRKCAALSPPQERLFVYAMVDTLCSLRDIRQVRFYIDGQAAETFVSEISFLSPLMYNGGLVEGSYQGP